MLHTSEVSDCARRRDSDASAERTDAAGHRCGNAPAAGDRSAGFSLIEVAIGLFVLAASLAAAGAALTSSFNVSNEVSAGVRADNSLRRVYQQIISEMRFVDPAEFVIPNPSGSSQVGFRRVEGWNGTSPILGPVRTLSFDDGTLMLDGAVLAANLSDVIFSLDGEVLSVDLQYRYQLSQGGVATESVREMISPINR
ncbi:MAG: prepilin-type N-terminal cleavage/methylation domain-containing protein [Planctomycetes bacterium]|nr:prepilin-type N-terminal cleavage/methylation domain-containing protein [Planctomycetota bacterium]